MDKIIDKKRFNRIFRPFKNKMNELTIMTNELFGEVRFAEIDGKPYAVGEDIALGYSISCYASTICYNHVEPCDYSVTTKGQSGRQGTCNC